MPDYNEKLEDLLDHHLITNKELVKKQKLGGIGYTLNGNMCLGIYENALAARIGESLAESLKSRPGIYAYLPGQDQFNDLVLVAEEIWQQPEALSKFINQSIEYTSRLPSR